MNLINLQAVNLPKMPFGCCLTKMRNEKMKKQIILFLLSVVIIQNNINADIMTELAKIDRDNAISIAGRSYNVLYAKNGYLYTDTFTDGLLEPSIVAYNIQKDAIILIIRNISTDYAYRENYNTDDEEVQDWFRITVHDYYLVELLYKNDKLETSCKPVKEINTEGFIFNEAKISDNINKISEHYYLTNPRLETKLTEGTKIKIVSMTDIRTKTLSEYSSGLEIYDYYYHIFVYDKKVRINGYLLDFDNKMDYRTQLLIMKSGNTPQATPPEEASDYFGTWIHSSTGGMGHEYYRRTITITITPDKFIFHFKGSTLDYGYTLINPTWTKIIRPDEDFQGWVGMPVDEFKGVSGYLITGTLTDRTGNLPDIDSITEYIFLRPDWKDYLFWYNFSITNYILVRQK